MKIGIMGCGSIAKTLVNFKLNNKLNVDLAYFYDLNLDNAKKLAQQVDAKVSDSLEDLIENSDLILESASQGAVRNSIPQVLENGTNVVIMSVGALLDEDFRLNLESIAKKNGAKIYLPTGAITGIDTVKAAKLGEIESVTLITRKPPLSLGLELEGDDEIIIFSGKASEAVNKFPKNINVSSTLSLASGMDADVKIIADPKISRNTHEIHLKGTFGELTTITSNVSSPDNPKTSLLAAYSAAGLLNKLSETIQIGT
ncbi:aspartate dehydrogenase [Methanosphaera sp.]|uniref:aspartate dehydrogenase n=1 Tax=Methanosphaera sp. TaxID=2666342 RepID=UPI0025E6E221|nr:aspartate dehydrogenase [Methanosphaera sp.]MEE1117923.1 aspartate dehydrogenase [Methanosphaera sp.]MEE3323916.1 aspartate dehydrogenase [Methanosphaera sp.]